MKTPDQMMSDLEETGQRAYHDFGLPATRVTCMEAKETIKELVSKVAQLRGALEQAIRSIRSYSKATTEQLGQPGTDGSIFNPDFENDKMVKPLLKVLSTPPPPVVPKEVADKLAEAIKQIFDTPDCKDLQEYTGLLQGYSFQLKCKICDDLKSALTAYEQHTK